MSERDVIRDSASGREFTLDGLIAYQGRKGCTDPRCTRIGGGIAEDGTWMPGECVGYHCARCGRPSSMYGHARKDGSWSCEDVA